MQFNHRAFPLELSKDEIEAAGNGHEKNPTTIQGREPKKVIVVPGKNCKYRLG